jgi:two-component system, NarL family, nitrate/nitrite response regulator NarL
MMRILICDDHVVFAESLACLLGALGPEVVAITFHPNQAIAVLRHEPVDVGVFDVAFGTETVLDRLAEIRAAAPATRLVLLGARLDAQIIAAGVAGGVHGIADKRLPAAEIMHILERVNDGELVLPVDRPPVRPTRAAPGAPADYPRRLAAFLTPRERQVLGALVCGRDTIRLARELGIAETTARCHIQSVLIKLGAHSRLEAATTAVRFGMIEPQTGRWLLPIL